VRVGQQDEGALSTRAWHRVPEGGGLRHFHAQIIRDVMRLRRRVM